MPKESLTYQLFKAVAVDKTKQSVQLQTAPAIKAKDMGKFMVLKKFAHVQADLIYMFTDPNETDPSKIYKYCLTVVDVASGAMDAEPLHDRTAHDIVEAFETIFKRKYITKDIEVLQTDQGAEFKNKIFTEYINGEGIELRHTMTNRHQQTAPVEAMNHLITKTIYTKKTSEELETGEPVVNWVEMLPSIVKVLNKKENMKTVKISDFFGPPKTTNNELNNRLEIGTIVHVRLQQPKDALTDKRMHGGFRNGDLRYEKEVTRINNIMIYPNQPIRYRVDKYDNVTFIRKELLLATPEDTAKYNSDNPIKKDEPKPQIKVSEHKGPITRAMTKKNILV